jgi:hypothetical protein
MPGEKTERIAKKLEMAANIAIVIVALGVVAMFVRNYRADHSPARSPQTVAIGAKFALKNASWQASGNNLVLALSTTCHFCTESAGFYQELVKQCQAGHVRTIALLPQSPAEADAYLSHLGIKVDEVRQVSLPEVNVSGTPTLVLVDQQGSVKDVWYGKLAPAREQEVLSKVGPSS